MFNTTNEFLGWLAFIIITVVALQALKYSIIIIITCIKKEVAHNEPYSADNSSEEIYRACPLDGKEKMCYNKHRDSGGVPMPFENNDAEYFGNDPEIIDAIRRMCLFDDDFMSAVFSNIKCAEYLVRVLLGRDDLSVIDSVPQYEIKNIYGRSVVLDIYAKDSTGKLYDIEVQRDVRGASPRRARYNSSLMDAHNINAGDDCELLPETYVIFITEKDYFKEGEPIYFIDRTLRSSGKPFDDGEHIIYVNGANRDDTEIGRLMQDFSEINPDKFHNKVLGEEVRHYKYNERGVNGMCKIVEEYADKRAKEREEKRAVEERRQFALRLIIDGTLPFEKIAELTKLSLEDVKALADKTSA